MNGTRKETEALKAFPDVRLVLDEIDDLKQMVVKLQKCMLELLLANEQSGPNRLDDLG